MDIRIDIESLFSPMLFDRLFDAILFLQLYPNFRSQEDPNVLQIRKW